MAFKRLDYTDEEGRKFLVEVPDGFENMPAAGIRIGPPDLGSLELPIELEVKLNNQLFDRKLFTLADVRQRPIEIKATLQAIFRLDVLKIRNLYREE